MQFLQQRQKCSLKRRISSRRILPVLSLEARELTDKLAPGAVEGGLEREFQGGAQAASCALR